MKKYFILLFLIALPGLLPAQTTDFYSKILGSWVIINHYEDGSGRYDKTYWNFNPNRVIEVVGYHEFGYGDTFVGTWSLKGNQLNIDLSNSKIRVKIRFEPGTLVFINPGGVEERLSRVKSTPLGSSSKCPVCIGTGTEQCSRCYGKGYNEINGYRYDCDGGSGTNCVNGRRKCYGCNGTGRQR